MWGAAVFGLIGVIIGGVITAGSAYLADRRREESTLREARLLVTDALEKIWIQLRLIRQNGHVPALDVQALKQLLPTDAWHEHKGVLARSKQIPKTLWRDLARTFYAAETINSVLLIHGPGRELPAERLLGMEDFTMTISDEYRRLAGEPIGGPDYVPLAADTDSELS
jgi:hypothetical protein